VTETPTAGLAWHALDTAETLAHLGTDADRGLTADEARRRLARGGANRIAEHAETPLWRLALDQFRSLIVLLLLAAAAIAWTLAERAEALAILAALLLNAAIGFGSEWRARHSLARLRSLAVPHALVKRDGLVLRLPSAELVPGDLVLLEAGSRVPADARLIQSAAYRVSEAALTGESDAVEKDAMAQLDPRAPLARRRTMTYLGTTALAGNALAVVTATGLSTELGRIGQLVALAGTRTTPLERQVEALGRRLMALALGICAVVGMAGILHGEPVALMLETAVSLAVAAIPEGLPAVTSLALAAGLWRLARRGALVRRLSAVETLGSTTVIAVDKTGTMTENQMTVIRLSVDGRSITVTDGGRSAIGRFIEHGRAIAPGEDPRLRVLLTVGALVNNANAVAGPDGLELHGDPTEAALLVVALKAGLDPAQLGREWPRRREIPFDPALRMMATFQASPAHGPVLLVKGAPGVVLDLSRRRHASTGVVSLDEPDRARIRENNRALASEGLRVLAMAWRALDSTEDTRVDDLIFLGLVGLADPVRPGVKEAIAACAQAGIRTIMLTGDQESTALAVGRQLGLSPEAIRSRVSPEGKLALIEELQAQGQVVAMTGDGVNDAPALARADIGVAMGRHGTDVARDASDLVLTDDNFTTIVRAVEEGRVIYANLQKVIHFLFSCNLSEILTIFVAILLGLPSPLLPLQILWVNLVTDILPAIALIRDPAEPDIMRRPPRDPRVALVTWRFGGRMLAEGAWLAAGVLSAYLWVIWQAGPGPRAATMAFMALVLIHPFQAMNCRSQRFGWWRLPSNPLVWLALLALIGLQWLSISLLPLARLLGTVPLGTDDLVVLVIGVLWPAVTMEIAKGWEAGKSLGRSRPSRPGSPGPPPEE
jgi:P-type Ca2+ transporter type 2C